MRNHLRIFGSFLLAATLCVTADSFAQTNVEEYGDPMTVDDSLDPTNSGGEIGIPLPGDVDYTATSVAEEDGDEMRSLFIYGGLLMLGLVCIGMLILATRTRRKPPQRIQL